MSHNIEVRKVHLAFTGEQYPIWHPHQPEWSHMVNGASLTMPYLEPFLVKNMREAITHLNDPELIEDARGFIGQEAQHYQNHRRYNEMLKAGGYPELEKVEARLQASYERLSKRSLAWRLAYSAGFETMTMGITEWLINDRERLFKDADPLVASFVLWHMVEETEHKSVAFDVFQAVSGNYLLRMLGLVYGSLHVGFGSRWAYMAMLKKDKRWYNVRARLRLWAMVGRFFVKAGGAMLRATKPGHHPDETSDPAWIDTWQAAYRQTSQTNIPLLDTSDKHLKPCS